jgi:hypothetical protein
MASRKALRREVGANLLASALTGTVVRPQPRARSLSIPLGAALAAAGIVTAWTYGGLPHG